MEIRDTEIDSLLHKYEKTTLQASATTAPVNA